MSTTSSLFQLSGQRLYDALYDFVRRRPALNHLAHRVTQGESLHRLPLYGTVYRRFIDRKARRYMACPPRLEITLTDACNARCIMCPPEVHLGKTIMSQALFEKIVCEAEEIGIHKMIITGGEPLLDKRIVEKIRFAKAHGFAYVHMFTNGSLMNEQRACAIIESGLDSLTWSIDSAKKKEYEKIRINLKFDVVISNLRRFFEIRNRMGVKAPLTRVNMVTLPQNSEGRREFREFFGGFVDIVEVIDSHNFADNKADIVVDQAREYSQRTRYPCHLLFQKVIVNPNGTVNKCGIDFGLDSIVGDLNKQTIRTVLRSKPVRRIKEEHLSYDFTDTGCNRCTHKESWWIKP